MEQKSDYKEIYDNSPTAILFLDNNGIVLDVNKRTSEWLDMKPKELIGRSIFMLKKLPKESKVIVLEKFEQRIEGKVIAPYEVIFKGKGGEARVGAVSATPILNDKGDIKKILVVVTDITNLRKGEGFSGSEDLVYRTIFDNSAVGIMIADEKERVVAWNKYTEELLDKGHAELFEKPIKTLYPEKELVKLSALNIRKENKQSHIETKMLKKDGSALDVHISISPLKDENGKVTGSIGVVRDITDRIQAQSHAKEADNKYQMIFENSAVGIMIADEKERVVAWNKYTEELLGKGHDDLHEKPIKELYPEEELDKLGALNIRKEDKKSHVETKMLKKDGSLLDVSISISALRDENGDVTGSIGVIRDITERKLFEEELLGASKAKGQFLSMVSHELRTPLTAIKGSLGIISEEAAGPLNDEQKDFLNTALGNIDRLDKQINDVLDYQRLESGREKFVMAEGNINIVLGQVEKMFSEKAQEKGLELKLELDESIPSFILDEEKMSRVFRNLLDNAIKFTDKGSIRIVSKLEGKEVCVDIQDTGIGINQEDIEKLFEPFGQISTGDGRKTGNMGLGLVIARSIVKHHKGEIWVKSEVGNGSVFSIYIPCKEK